MYQLDQRLVLHWHELLGENKAHLYQEEKKGKGVGLQNR